jgi:DNA ligase (NAD+)
MKDHHIDLLNREQDLITEINHHSHHYYVEHRPTITDFEFDLLLNELKAIERDLGRALPHSPTQRVGADLSGAFKKVAHKRPMLSLENVFNAEDVASFFGGRVTELAVEPKFDGLSLALHYENGDLVLALTRGDGTQGEDVTANARTIRSIPLKVYSPLTGGTLTGEIRGEAFMRRSVFTALNQQREAAGEDLFANPRNAASGSLKLKSPAEVAKRNLDFVAYGLYGEFATPATHRERINLLATLGFMTPKALPCLDGTTVDLETPPSFNQMPHRSPAGPGQVDLFPVETIEKYRSTLDMDLDGAVLKVDSIPLQEELGLKAKSPRWACAFKFKPEEAVTVLDNIEITVGRTGQICPVAVLEPVTLEGATVTSASMMNFDEWERIGRPSPGDEVVVIRSAMVIPRTVRVHLRRSEKIWSFPTVCPFCGTPLVRDGVHWFDPNSECPEQVYARLRHATAKAALDWDGMGEAQIRSGIRDGKWTKLSDLFTVDPSWLKTAALKKYLTERERVKTVPLWRKLAALGIEDVGQSSCKELAQKYRSILSISTASLGELEALLGPVATNSLVSFVDSNAEEIETLDSLGFKFEEAGSAGPLSGKNFVITGTLMSGGRDAVAAKIEKAGGLVKGSVSKNTSFVIVGDLPGNNKTAAAKRLGVPMIDEAALYEMMGQKFEAAGAEFDDEV